VRISYYDYQEVAMLDHVTIPVSDLEASRRFYEPLFGQLGATVVMEGPGLAVFGSDDGMVGLRQREELLPIHVAFRTKDRSGVDSFYETALRAGGTDNGRPGLRPEIHADYYAAFVHDPDS
jgi:catechol 2,3-dioxygenase-like lactoylglutathione lyase family enzyme